MNMMKPILTEVVGTNGEHDWVPDFYASEDNRGSLEGRLLMLWGMVADWEDEEEADENGDGDDGPMPLLR